MKMINEVLCFIAGVTVTAIGFQMKIEGIYEGRKFALDFMKERKAFELEGTE